jgi:hypothetical protein
MANALQEGRAKSVYWLLPNVLTGSFFQNVSQKTNNSVVAALSQGHYSHSGFIPSEAILFSFHTLISNYFKRTHYITDAVCAPIISLFHKQSGKNGDGYPDPVFRILRHHHPFLRIFHNCNLTFCPTGYQNFATIQGVIKFLFFPIAFHHILRRVLLHLVCINQMEFFIHETISMGE